MAQPQQPNLPNSINASAYQNVDWDIGHAIVWVDGTVPDIYPNSGNIVTCNWNSNQTQFVDDPMGHAIRIINHNGLATITLNLSRLSNVYKQVIASGRSKYNIKMHTIYVQDDAESFWTNQATLQKMPNIALSSSDPTASLTFQCAYVDIKPNNGAHEENGNNNYNVQ